MRKIILFLSLAALISGYAQNVASCDDENFRHIMRNLVSKGDLYYETSDRFGINRMMDSIITCLHQRSSDGKLDRMDSLEFTADWYKLQGSYHYENSYYDSTSYVKAHESYNKALDIYKRESAFDGDLRCEPMIHRELAQLYYKEKNYEKAFNHTKIAYDAFENAADLNEIDYDDSYYLDIQTQMAICHARMGNTKEAVTIIDKLVNRYDPKDVRYGEALRKKGKILMLQEENGGKTDRTKALECYRTFFNLKKKDAMTHFMKMNSQEREQYWMRVRPFVTDCYRLEDADAGFLYDVTLFAKGLLLQLDSAGGGQQGIHATWQMIQERLKPEACAIEFIQYEKYGRQQMGALVLKKTGNPVFVKMAEPDSVMQYKIDVKGNYLNVDSLIRAIHGPFWDDRVPRNRLYQDTLGLNNYIWNAELIESMGLVNDVWFAPDGYVHQLAIEYLLPKQIENVACHRLSSTRVLLTERNTIVGQCALIVGGVDYNAKATIKAYGNDAAAYWYAYNGGHPVDYAPLDSSLVEVRAIQKIRNNAKDSLLAGDLASELAFREACANYSVIHISSHGVFNAATIPQGTDIKQNLSDNALSQSHLAFAGINTTLKDNSFDASHQDGILSACEIASLNLSKAELVVLCCCETGLGFVTPDGVYGIQRGLKNAGAKSIVCTLWDIDDKASCFFMIRFYQYLKTYKDLHKAFCRAREAMKNDFDEPSYRDAFILIDAI